MAKTKSKKTVKLGRVELSFGYTVDVNDHDMIDEAKECVYEDVMQAVKDNTLDTWIKTRLAPEKTEADIPEFLLDSKRLRGEIA